jgi:NADPH:quinone reductase-like Zn-dependent oxidoreductase
MKAIIINKYGSIDVLQYEDIKKPSQVKLNQILIKNLASSVNPVDWKIRRGELRLFTLFQSFPRFLGADFVGIVEKVGEKVTQFQIGDFVYGFVDPLKGGAYAEYLVVNCSEVALIPRNLDCQQIIEIAGVPLAGLTALQALRDLGNIQPGEKVLINGASGGVGTFAVQIAIAMMAEVTAVCSNKNIELVKNLGAKQVIDYTQIDFLKLNYSYELIFDTVGNTTFWQCRKILAPKGIYVSTLPSFSHLLAVISTFIWGKQKAKIVIVNSKHEDLLFLNQLIEEKKLTPVLDKIYQFSELAQAHLYSETGRTKGKNIIKF